MKSLSETKIAFIGFGSMATAMADGFLLSGKIPAGSLGASSRRFSVLEEKTKARGMHAFASNEEAAKWCDVAIIAVKPYLIADVVKPLASVLKDKIVVSVAVNVLFDDYEAILEKGTHHLSILPNTPAAVCEGATVCEAKHSLTPEETELVTNLLKLLGLTVFADAKTMSPAGTVTGCGPAFAAMFIEALADGAVKHGVPRAMAYQLASQMLAGTAKLQLKTGTHPGAMKDAVCSPGGTTIVGVAALERRGFRSAVIDAIDAIENK
jgi:pyrroline-5-carboxylate reductase